MVFENITQSALHKARKANLQAFYAFNTTTPEDGATDFNAEDSAEGKEQMNAYLKLYLFPHAVLLRL